jgi:hypothetical protein
MPKGLTVEVGRAFPPATSRGVIMSETALPITTGLDARLVEIDEEVEALLAAGDPVRAIGTQTRLTFDALIDAVRELEIVARGLEGAHKSQS